MPNLTKAQSNAVKELLRLAPVISDLGKLFADAGHSLFLVGGSVRDALLGRLGNDLDFTTSANPDEIEQLLHQFTVPVWNVGKDFGTIGAQKESGGVKWTIEITTFRADSYHPTSRKPIVAFGDNITDDLVRRDFTVNAMAIDVTELKFVDPFHGLADLSAKILTTPSAPEVSFSDDPLRMLRAARFASQLGFSVNPEVVKSMAAMADRIEIVSAERIRDELSKLLLTKDPRPGLELLVETGLADRFLPELSQMRETTDEHLRHKDVYQHSLTVLEQGIELEKARNHDPSLVLRLALLLHDIGKPATRRFEAGGKVTFYHHDVVGAKMVRKRLRALHYPNEVCQQVAKLVELHLRFHGYGEASWTDSAVRRYVRDAGEVLEWLHILTRSDCTTRNRAKANRLRLAYEELEWRIDELAQQEELDSLRPALDGNQIMEILGIKPGKDVGLAYQMLLNARIEQGPMAEDVAVELLKKWWQEQQSAR